MKFEIGMYVKTRYGHIDKIKNIDVDWYCLDCDEIETPHKVYQLNNFYYDDNFDEVNDWVSETLKHLIFFNKYRFLYENRKNNI